MTTERTHPVAPGSGVETRIASWRGFVGRRAAISAADVDELEAHLRDQMADLQGVGLSDDEAFMVAVGRLGEVDGLSREYAREHSDRLWKQLVVGAADSGSAGRRGLRVALGLGVAAAVAVQVPQLFGIGLEDNGGIYVKNLPLLVLPFLAGFFVWRAGVAPGLRVRLLALVGVAVAVSALVLNLYPFGAGSASEVFPLEPATEVLAALHLPVALWLILGVAHAGGDWRSDRARMDYVRFTGEWFIYYVLIGLGGGVLLGLTAGVFSTIGVDTETAIVSWVLPCGAAGAVLVAAWLVGAKQGVIENMAPVLTRVFTPLFAVMLLAFGAAALWQGDFRTVDRELLIVFDLVLIVVLALVLYSVSARDPLAPPGGFERLQVVLLGSAIIVDLYVLVAMLTRIGAFGFSPNKVASLGLNMLLLVNLVGSVVMLVGFLRGRRPYAHLERWQTGYLPAYLAWAVIVGVAFGPVFGWV